MLLSYLFTDPYNFLIIFGALILTIGIHEAAHSFAADYLGDPTPRSLGRTTLNPLAHLDPLGTIAILITGFGWGKPAPFDPYNLKNPTRDIALIAFAGPASNLVLASLISILLRLPGLAFLYPAIITIIVLNINLALFNLLPVPPLDGSKIFLKNTRIPNSNSYVYLLLILLPLIGGVSIASLIISPISRFLLNLIIPA